MSPRDTDNPRWEIGGYVDYTQPEGQRWHPGEVTQADIDRGVDVRVGFRVAGESEPTFWRTIHGPLRDLDQLWDLIDDMEDKYGLA